VTALADLSLDPKVIPVRRISAALGSVALLVSLAACGNSTDAATGGLDSVTVSGDFDKAPEVAWKGQVTTDKLASQTLIEGEGDPVAEGDTVKLNIWIGNGFSQKTAYSTWDVDKTTKKAPGVQTVKIDSKLGKWLVEATVDHKVGSRVLVVAPPADAFGATGNSQLRIGNGDDVVFIIDIVGKLAAKDVEPGAVPPLVQKNGTPTGFDFSKSPKTPPAELQRATLKEGAGPVVTSGQKVKVNYLGSVYGSSKVFDQSFGKTPFETAIGQGAVISGWDLGIVGAKVGSRLELVIPADMAYGASGSGSTIPPNATLVFVVDIISAT
jgi:peptidylprolyl isomerase